VPFSSAYFNWRFGGMKKLHVFQHVPFETAGIISQWAEERGYAIATTQFFDGQLPDTGGRIGW
jgi:hypothetical protein